MVFSSLTFLWIFLPLVLLVNYLFSFIKKDNVKFLCKNINLLVASLVFYAWGGIYYLLVMLASIIGNYLFALWIDKAKTKQNPSQKSAKCALAFAIIFNLGLLFYFKYANFFVGVIESIIHGNFGLREVVLPIGISFFTFQAMSYVIDVYNEKVACQKNLLLLALYVSLFPQLIAGPIVKYQDVEHQLQSRSESLDNFVIGIKRFLYGLAKKVIVANACGKVAEVVFGSEISALGTGIAWLGLVCYSIQIYFDFSGYSDMAIGLGRMFGFTFNENFHYPYTSLSITEFWHRWHVSLSSWFKEYVYVPLGGNRKGKARTLFNLFIVFLLTGIWHGANYTFILWGVFYGVVIVIERLFFKSWLDKNKVKPLNWLYTALVVTLLWVFFRADSVSYAFAFICKLFDFSSGTLTLYGVIDLWDWCVLAFGILFCGFAQRLFEKPYNNVKAKTWVFWVDFALQIGLYFLCIVFLMNDSFNPFIYFQF